MTRNVILVPAGKTSGIYTAALGLVKALNNHNVKAALFTPFANCKNAKCIATAISICFALRAGSIIVRYIKDKIDEDKNN